MDAADTLKPYLLRALHEWCTDQGYTPMLVAVAGSGVQAPRQAVHDGLIALNVSYQATHQLQMGNDMITLSARFGGVSHPLEIPVQQVVSFYARETQEGMHWPLGEEAGADASAPPHDAGIASPPKPTPAAPTVRPHLRIIE